MHICLACNQIFEPRKPDQKYCSKRCRNAVYYKHYKERLSLPMRKRVDCAPCAVCGQNFKLQRPHQVYCSSRCYNKARYIQQKRRHPNPLLVERKCEHCHQLFIPNHGKRRYCSDRCRWQASNVRNLDSIRQRNRQYTHTDAYRTHHRAYHRNYLANPEHRIRLLIKTAARRAARRNLIFEEALFITLSPPPSICCCCHAPLDFTTGRGRGNFQRSPSLDRIESEKGYTVINTRVICMFCNTRKRDTTAEELRTILTYIEREKKIDTPPRK